MYTREMASVLKRLATLYPIVGITGPRQSGKTTLAKQLFSKLPYVSLEDLDIRLQAQQDPRSFLKTYHTGAIFDEIQQAPVLLSYLQTLVDENPKKGRYVITGSQNFALSANIAQSLSGRVGMVTLLPLSLSELRQKQQLNPFETIFKGSYPGLYQRQMHPLDFYPSYLQTYVERDLRQLKHIDNLARFQTFLKLCAGRIGQLVNFSSLAQDASISTTTARTWLSLLETSYILFTLRPYHQNFNKRLVKMPKLYFYDTGLACALLGLEQDTQLFSHYLKGGLFENLVILDVLKGRLNQGLPPNLYFWRDRTGHEVDLIGEWGGRIYAMEIKCADTFQKDYVRQLNYFTALCQKKSPLTLSNYLIYTGKQQGHYFDIRLTPLHTLNNRLWVS